MGVYIVLGGGILLAFLALGMEILWHNKQRRQFVRYSFSFSVHVKLADAETSSQLILTVLRHHHQMQIHRSTKHKTAVQYNATPLQGITRSNDNFKWYDYSFSIKLSICQLYLFVCLSVCQSTVSVCFSHYYNFLLLSITCGLILGLWQVCLISVLPMLIFADVSLSVCSSVCLFICLSIYLSVCWFFYLCLSVYQCLSSDFCLSVC